MGLAVDDKYSDWVVACPDPVTPEDDSVGWDDTTALVSQPTDSSTNLRNQWGPEQFDRAVDTVRGELTKGTPKHAIPSSTGYTLAQVETLLSELLTRETSSGILSMDVSQSYLNYCLRMEGVIEEIDAAVDIEPEGTVLDRDGVAVTVRLITPGEEAKVRLQAAKMKGDIYERIHKVGLEAKVFSAPKKAKVGHLHLHMTLAELEQASQAEKELTRAMVAEFGTIGYNGVDVVGGLPQLPPIGEEVVEKPGKVPRKRKAG